MDHELASPWLTTRQAAELLKCSVETIRRHARRYEDSGGRDGLKVMQRGEGPILVHYDDLIRWRRGEPPTRGERRWRGESPMRRH